MKEFYNLIENMKSYEGIDYSFSLKFMQDRVNQIINNNQKELIWFLNHDHMYTCGTSAKDHEILKKTNIPIIYTNRGGKITYHGPGQRIVYLMIDLNKRKKDIRRFITLIEKTIIQMLEKYNIQSRSFHNRIGIWVTKVNGKYLLKEKKIAAIGLRIKKWITYHGLSFNINPDLSHYDNIVACGLQNYATTSLEELNINISEKEFDNMFLNLFNKNLEIF